MSNEEDEYTICQECGQRRASIHLTDFGPSGPQQLHLCEECYNKRSDVPPLDQNKVVAQLIAALAPEMQKLATSKCPDCGMSYLEFRQTFRLGCPKDYDVFREPLDEFLGRIHIGNRHLGKAPKGRAQRDTSGARLDVLQRKLAGAVEKEDFREAAGLRDEIREMEQQGAEGVGQ